MYIKLYYLNLFFQTIRFLSLLSKVVKKKKLKYTWLLTLQLLFLLSGLNSYHWNVFKKVQTLKYFLNFCETNLPHPSLEFRSGGCPFLWACTRPCWFVPVPPDLPLGSVCSLKVYPKQTTEINATYCQHIAGSFS